MAFQLDKVSNYGTTTPAVARTFLQGSELMNLFALSDELKEQLKERLWDLQKNLLRCHELEQEISAEIERGRLQLREDGPDVQADGKVLRLPAIPDLDMKIESFLQSTKLAIRDCGRVLGVLSSEEFSHRIDRIKGWTKDEYGDKSGEFLLIEHWEKWAKPIIELRNLVDHPKDQPAEKLSITGFRAVETDQGWGIQEPHFGSEDGQMFSISPSLANIVEGIIRMGEDMLTVGLYRHRGELPVEIVEIPEEQRDPKCPIRLKADIRIS